MYRFSFTESVAGKAREVSRQLFEEILDRENIKSICAEIAKLYEDGRADDDKARQDAVGKLKKQLPAFCWHAWFEGGKRKNYTAHASGMVMMDIDHLEDPRSLYTSLERKAKKLGLLAAHVTPSTHGLRLVFPVPDGMDLEEAQTHYAKALKLKNVDACTKDLARLSFCVPRKYWMFVSDDLFALPATTTDDNPKPAEGESSVDNLQPAKGKTRNSAKSAAGESAADSLQPVKGKSKKGVQSAEGEFAADSPQPVKGKSKKGAQLAEGESSADSLQPAKGELKNSAKSAAGESSADSLQPAEGKSKKGAQPAEGESSADGLQVAEGESLADEVQSSYDGIPYDLLVSELCTLLGGEPAHGSRNNFIFSMAAYLRYVCNDDPDWIASVLPTYGEGRDKWRRTIDSACQRSQHKQMPTIVRRAIENARQKLRTEQLEVDEEGDELPPPMPGNLPPLIQHLVKNVPEVCRPAVANAVFPSLAAHLNGVKFWLLDGTEKEATFMCVTMAKQSSGKSAANKPIEYIVADMVERDEVNRKREQEWKDAMAQKGANKEKPKRPEDLCVQVLVSDMTNAAFVQRMKDANGKYLYTNIEELDLLKQLQTNGTRDVGKIICLCFDNGKYGQERVGTQSVTGRVDLRWNWNAASTIRKGIRFFQGRLMDGTLSRLNFCTIVPDKTKPFSYGRYDKNYAEELKPYIANLNLAHGIVECKPALELSKRMLDRCLEEGALTDDEVYQDLAYRAVTIAYLKAMVLYIAHDMTWTKELADFAEWSLDYDLWCKYHFFGQQMMTDKEQEEVRNTRGRKNLLELLPNTFTLKQAQQVRKEQGLDNKAKHMLRQWVCRGYIVKDEIAQIYLKTEQYRSTHQPSSCALPAHALGGGQPSDE